MVKNTQGGNKHKSQARKLVNPSFRQSNLRIAQEEGEIYAQVIKMLGNAMVYVSTLTGEKMLCIIRGKFKDRGKRDNFLKCGSWVLVGQREWDITSQNLKKERKCDLLEVYSDIDKDKLKNTVNENWKNFDTNENNNKNAEDDFDFSNQEQEDYTKIIKEMDEGQNISLCIMEKTENTIEEEIDFNDI